MLIWYQMHLHILNFLWAQNDFFLAKDKIDLINLSDGFELTYLHKHTRADLSGGVCRCSGWWELNWTLIGCQFIRWLKRVCLDAVWDVWNLNSNSRTNHMRSRQIQPHTCTDDSLITGNWELRVNRKRVWKVFLNMNFVRRYTFNTGVPNASLNINKHLTQKGNQTQRLPEFNHKRYSSNILSLQIFNKLKYC